MNSALLAAVCGGHANCVDLLIQAGADVNKANVIGNTPLIFAAGGGHCQCVGILIEAGAEVNKIVRGRTALMHAAGIGCGIGVKKLIEAGADVNQAGPKHRSALQIAVQGGFGDITEMLIEAGADVNAHRCFGTALHLAVLRQDLRCVKMLLLSGAYVDAMDSRGNTPAITAARLGNAQCLLALVQHGSCIDNWNHDGFSPLMLAAKNNHSGCVQILLEAGADVALVNETSGYTALQFAVKMYAADCALLIAQVEPNLIKAYQVGDKAMEIARSSGMVGVCDFLKFHRPLQIHFTESILGVKGRRLDTGMKSLLAAAGIGDIDTLVVLIRAGANLNAESTCNVRPTALFEAAKNDHIFCMKLLLAAGANVNIKSKFGHNALEHYVGLLECIGQVSAARRDTCLLLHAAGETAGPGTLEILVTESATAADFDFLLHTDLSLQNLCRETICCHLRELDPHGNLFHRVPRLGLPRRLARYVLYDVSLGKAHEWLGDMHCHWDPHFYDEPRAEPDLQVESQPRADCIVWMVSKFPEGYVTGTTMPSMSK